MISSFRLMHARKIILLYVYQSPSVRENLMRNQILKAEPASAGTETGLRNTNHTSRLIEITFNIERTFQRFYSVGVDGGLVME